MLTLNISVLTEIVELDKEELADLKQAIAYYLEYHHPLMKDVSTHKERVQGILTKLIKASVELQKKKQAA